MTARLALLLALAASLAGCTPPVGLTDVQVVSGFRVDPTFNAFTGPCNIRYTLAEPAFVAVRDRPRRRDDGSAPSSARSRAERRETRGARTAAWRGVGTNGLFAPQGDYTVELYARLDGSDRVEQWALTTIMFRT